MKITLVAVGKTGTSYIQKGIDEYIGRLKHYIGFDLEIVPDIKGASSLGQEQQKVKEGEGILSKINSSDRLILLDEHGTEYTSRGFSDMISRNILSGVKRVVFVIGGPYGFSKQVYDRADAKFSLSQLTMPHELARLFFVEQLYRAMTILKGESYHHD